MNIDSVLKDIIDQKVEYRFMPEFDPDCDGAGIRALTMEGMEYMGKKTKIFAYYGIPEAANEKTPAIVLIHGGGGHAYHCWVKSWMDRGYAAIAMDTTGYVPAVRSAGDREGDSECWTRELHGAFKEDGYALGPANDGMRSADRPISEQWMLHALAAAITAHNFLREQPRIDPQKIGVSGVSWGGVITSLLIGYDDRFAFAVPIYGSGYLGDSLVALTQVFKEEAVARLWLAEDRFDRVKMPVLWFAWNDDPCFSLHANSASYLHTVKNNAKTRISMVHRMYHSHCRAWVREEPFFFADSVVKGGASMPSLHSVSEDGLCLEVFASEACTDPKATLFYLTEPMEYRKFDKYGEGECDYMCEAWKTAPCEMRNGMITLSIPKETLGYYVELEYTAHGKNMTVCTPYQEI